MNKKMYETCEIEILTFTDEDVMGASGFVGGGDDLTSAGEQTLNGWSNL